MVRYLPFLISLVLTIYALFSCIQTDDEDVPHLPKLLWVLLIVLLPFVGPLTWLLMARSHARKRQARTPGSSSYGAGPARRSTAPDDDPEFLAWLDRNRKRREQSDPPVADPPAADPSAADSDDPDDGEAGDRAR